ncbi:MAG: UDP-N-acetylglucosamine--N-acetylmuramyl-(pentapeptide) pyrophosphoryl-undecaprenol N-acetylglucosamine transferase [Candidatus Euphemobacter frigidus]|nr:UDP-N-acetylglucosamine--N-acetylmuramyl-(pentapeptide) pyrophosphoryl-undecaprenol N-acetylglucosamine transferase [Candidatus Euphemobacter frigidus]MDP8275870.1 UDP-N-acetylglucosamine--N-acetylmuramyl-(pentapeptide) pyrophosphoryl-undecaprenol N-acetylglucosamine transferase [Candidatus Euphemobacter frigidus]
MKLAFAGGGTGGHLAPALALLEELRARGDDSPVIFLTDGRAAPDVVRQVRISAASFSFRRWWSIPAGLIRNYRGYRRGRSELAAACPDLVVGLGGYVSVPTVLAARRLKIPIVLHEQNAVLGRANRFLSRFASRVIGSFPLPVREGGGPDPIRTGFPIRRAVRAEAPESTASGWGLEEGRFTILVLGGSRGARAVNRLAVETIQDFRDEADNLQFIHCAGREDVGVLERAYRKAGVPAAVFDALETIGWAYSLADLVVGRAGGATLSEIAYWRLPSILIPYPWATDAHQRANARYFQGAGAALVYEQDEVSTSLLVESVLRLKEDREERERMSRAAGTLYISGGAGRMLDIFQEVIEEKHETG